MREKTFSITLRAENAGDINVVQKMLISLTYPCTVIIRELKPPKTRKLNFFLRVLDRFIHAVPYLPKKLQGTLLDRA